MLNRIKIELEDKIRYSKFCRSALCFIKKSLVNVNVREPQEIARAIHRLCEAARLATTQKQQVKIENDIKALIHRLNKRKIDWKEFEPTAENRLIESATVLKPYISEREKGIIYLSFEYQWTRILQNCNVDELSKYYRLVLAPVWAVPYSLVNFLFPVYWDDIIFSHLSDPNDTVILPRISPNYITVPLLCSSWVNPDWFKPVPFEKKDIDLIMLANFGKYKRHFVLFKALRNMPESVRIVLIGQRNAGRTREVLMKEAQLYGVENRFELWENANDEQVFDALARAKTSVILSLREGSCVAVVESIFANTPVALFKNAEVGSRIFINEHTGIFLEPENAGHQLFEFIKDAHKFTPRKWAMENKIHCFESSRILNEKIKQVSLARNEEWTQDIVQFHWRPYPKPINDTDRARLQKTRKEIKEKFGIVIGKDTFE